MRNRPLLAVLLAAMLPACGPLQRQRAVPLAPPTGQSLYGTLAQAVVRLETRREFDEQTFVSSPVGTGFLVERSGELFLVTARHVAEATQESRVRDSVSSAEFVIPRSAWVFHPADSGRQQRGSGEWLNVDPVDVAVARLPWPKDVRVQPLLYCPGSCNGRRNQLASRDPEPLEPVLAVGYPSYLTFELRKQLPLLRFGAVAMTASEPFLKTLGGRTYVEARARVLDLRSFAGDSGSPVFEGSNQAEGLMLVGMILGGDAELGFAIAEPVSRVLETLELAARPQAPTGMVHVHYLPTPADVLP
ncbi:MAG TPA: trypsin-like peptidase domain-containing protein [Archangium sp.]|uniref:trypsin-like peptidase domain-containing protein n=1 Tax=Archangium sp. TaxID=1872627 RepID=UPI002ED8A3D8